MILNYLESKDFQTQFVYDVVNDFNNKIKLGDVNILQTTEDDLFQNGIDEDAKLNIEYDVHIIYNYLGKDMSFDITFNGNNIRHGMGGYYKPANYGTYTPPEGDAYYTYVNWNDINFEIYNKDSGLIKLDWLHKNPKLYAVFVRNFVEDVLTFDIRQRG